MEIKLKKNIWKANETLFTNMPYYTSIFSPKTEQNGNLTQEKKTIE